MWYKPNTWGWVQKLNPAQADIQNDTGTDLGSDTNPYTYKMAFDTLESVNRGASLIINACSSLDYDIKNKKVEGIAVGTRAKALENLLNFRPNPYQSVQEFRKNIFTDFILEGNAFIYFDGAFMYHIPAASMVINTDAKTFVSSYTYGTTEFGPDEIMHFKDISSTSIYRGVSRLVSADRSIKVLKSMHEFQENFFKNGAIPGLVFTSDNTLSSAAKEKTLIHWTQRYSPKNGARRPMILDSGLKPSQILNTSFQEMDFDVSIKTHDTKILKALGVPPILMDGGNNANISPNLRLFYLETVLPIVRSYVSAIERYFGYDVEAVTNSVSALQPDLKEISSYLATLVNGGVITPNEARVEIRYPAIEGQDLDSVRIPANIAGSAADPSQGGKPPKPKE